MGNSIAGVVFSFNRPNHTYQFCKSLEECIEIDDMDWIFMQDGAVNMFTEERVAKQADIERSIKAIESADIPNKNLIVNDWNISVGLQVDRVFSLFSEYDLILFFENDVRLSKYSIRIFKILMDQFDNSVTSIYRKLNVENINNPEQYLDTAVEVSDVRYSGPLNLHTFGIWESEYNKIKDEWDKYASMITGVDYRDRPKEKIAEEFNAKRGSTDWVVKSLLDDAGVRGVLPVISRASYMGVEGVHSHKRGYYEGLGHGAGTEGHIEYEQDKDISSFDLIPIEEEPEA